MQVKRFVAANMRLALKMVREELGPEAVILSNKRVAQGVELLTALDQPEPPAAAEVASSDNPFQQTDSPFSGAPAHDQPSKLEQEWGQMQRQTQQRAQALAAALARQSEEQKEALLDERQLATDVVDVSTAGTKDATSIASPADNTLVDKIMAGGSSADESVAGNVAARNNVTANTAALDTQACRDDELSHMRFELQSMRDLLEQQLSTMAWGQFHQHNPQKASLWRRLKRMGMAPAVANDLLEELDDAGDAKNNWQFLMSDLGKHLPVLGEELTANGGVFAFVGPTGAGKTTTIGKLAARYVLQHGAGNVALVTTDTVRIAAHEQLRTFGRILNVPVKVVDKQNSLESVLYSLRHKSLVLVDSAGLNRQDPNLQQQLTRLNELGNRISSVLVIPTTSQVAVIKAAYHTYKLDNLKCCVLTKLDETASLGEAISLVVEKQLPVAYSTNGQAIPDDITVADSVSLIRTAIDLAKHTSTSDDAMADAMSEARASLVKG